MKIQLTHYSNLTGAEGQPGQVIDVDPTLGKLLIARKGAKLVSAKVAAAPAAAVEEAAPVAANEGAMEDEPESADAEHNEQPETAARRRARR